MSQALSWTEVAYVHTVTHHVLILNRDGDIGIVVIISAITRSIHTYCYWENLKQVSTGFKMVPHCNMLYSLYNK